MTFDEKARVHEFKNDSFAVLPKSSASSLGRNGGGIGSPFSCSTAIVTAKPSPLMGGRWVFSLTVFIESFWTRKSLALLAFIKGQERRWKV